MVSYESLYPKLCHNCKSHSPSGVAYAKPSKQNVTKVDIEDDEKYQRLDDIVEKGAVVPHNITPSGVAYALPNKSETGPPQIPDEDDDKYMTIDSIDEAVTQDPDPDDGQAYHAYENPDPPDPDVIVPEQSSSKGKHLILSNSNTVW